MTSFFDVFSDTQFSGTLPSSGTTHWGPTPSNRNLAAFPILLPVGFNITQNINSTSPGNWFCSVSNQSDSPQNFQFLLNYDFSSSPTDFSQLTSVSITLTSGDLALLNLLTLTLNDGTNSHTDPGSVSASTKTWSVQTNFPGVILTHITSAEFDMISSVNIFQSLSATFDNLISLIICLDKDSSILMADQSVKLIGDIQRGDWVAGDLGVSKKYQVARVNKQNLDANHPSNLLIFEVDCLGNNQPSKKLIITENHPIIYQDARRPAYCFQNCPGVTYHQKMPASLILSKDDLGKYSLYDLQFEHDGTYVANGLIVQSRSPYSELTPLPSELYFDQRLYTDETVGDSYDQPLPLDLTLL